MAFAMKCPKCGSRNFAIRRDTRTYSQMDEIFQLVFSCRCGKQLFGTAVVEEYERQKREWESNREEREDQDRARAAENIATKKTREALREAYAYRQSYLYQKRLEHRADQERRQAASDAAWRERVGQPDLPSTPPPVQPSVPEPAAAAAAAVPAPQPAAAATPAPEPAAEAIPEAELCAWPGCGKRRRPRSKYCSRACSNKNARARYKNRKVK